MFSRLEQLTFKPVVALLGDLVQESEGRPVVVRPMVVRHSAAKVAFRVIRCSLRRVYDVVLVAVL